MKKIINSIICLLFICSIAFSQNVTYKVYDIGTNDINADKIIKVIPVPQGNMFIVQGDKGALFKLYDKEMKLISTKPMIQDVTEHRALVISDIYKIGEKLQAVFWSVAFIKDKMALRRSCIIFDYDLTGTFIKSTTLPDMKSTVEQDLYLSADSTKYLYWASINTLKSGLTSQMMYEDVDKRFLSFRVYDTQLKELSSEDFLLDFVTLDKKQTIKILNASISNDGMVYFFYTILSNEYDVKPKLFCIVYDPKTKKKYNKLVSDAYDAGSFFSYFVQYDNAHVSAAITAFYDPKKPTVDYKNKYQMIQMADTNVQMVSEIKMPLKLNNYQFLEFGKVTDAIEKGYGDVYFLEKENTSNGYFLSTSERGLYISQQDALYVTFVDNSNKYRFIDNMATDYGLDVSYIYANSNYVFKDKLVTLYFHHKKTENASSFNYMPMVTITDQDGNMKHTAIAKELNPDLNELTRFHEIGEGKYLVQLSKSKKYIIITIE